jgi:hypothetical protein
MTAHPRSRSSRVPRGRVASWATSFIAVLATLILLVQLFAAVAHHDHELAAKSQHCVACVLHAHPDAAPPDAPPSPAPTGWALRGVLPPFPVTSAAAPPSDHLLPPAHAPPPFLSLR